MLLTGAKRRISVTDIVLQILHLLDSGVIMTEYWQSQARKFCDFCKCWIADQKVSIEFHENGKRHQQAVKDRLRDIGQKGARDERKTAKEELWMKQIEQQAMKDYRAKDLQENSDLTAKIFNEKRCERDKERASEKNSLESERITNTSKTLTLDQTEDDELSESEPIPIAIKGPGPPIWGVPSKLSPTVSHCSAKKNPFEQRISAKTHGTKYHNPPPATNWREAMTEDGNVYYWHTTSYASVWEPPAEGYLSIKDQEKLTERQQKIDDMKAKKIRGANKGNTPAAAAKQFSTQNVQGPVPKSDPYGSWKPVPENECSANHVDSTNSSVVIDYQTPEVKQAPASNVVLHKDRTKKFEVDSKKTPSLGRNDDHEFHVDFNAGIKTSASSKVHSTNENSESSSSTLQPDKPVIVFRKRKVNPDHRKVARRREDGDD